MLVVGRIYTRKIQFYTCCWAYSYLYYLYLYSNLLIKYFGSISDENCEN